MVVPCSMLALVGTCAFKLYVDGGGGGSDSGEAGEALGEAPPLLLCSSSGLRRAAFDKDGVAEGAAVTDKGDLPCCSSDDSGGDAGAARGGTLGRAAAEAAAASN